MTPSIKSSNVKDSRVATTRPYLTFFRDNFQTLCWSTTDRDQFNGVTRRSIRPDCRDFHCVWARPNIDSNETRRFSPGLMIVSPRTYVVIANSQAVDFKSYLPAFGNFGFDLQSGSHDYLIGRR